MQASQLSQKSFTFESIGHVNSSHCYRRYQPGSWLSEMDSRSGYRGWCSGTYILTPYDLAAQTFERALAQKKLITRPGGHFDAYVADFDAASRAAIDWFNEHLGLNLAE
jgi:hypothetical protein